LDGLKDASHLPGVGLRLLEARIDLSGKRGGAAVGVSNRRRRGTSTDQVCLMRLITRVASSE
jgi:hypothetical protein